MQTTRSGPEVDDFSRHHSAQFLQHRFFSPVFPLDFQTRLRTLERAGVRSARHRHVQLRRQGRHAGARPRPVREGHDSPVQRRHRARRGGREQRASQIHPPAHPRHPGGGHEPGRGGSRGRRRHLGAPPGGAPEQACAARVPQRARGQGSGAALGGGHSAAGGSRREPVAQRARLLPAVQRSGEQVPGAQGRGRDQHHARSHAAEGAQGAGAGAGGARGARDAGRHGGSGQEHRAPPLARRGAAAHHRGRRRDGIMMSVMLEFASIRTETLVAELIRLVRRLGAQAAANRLHVRLVLEPRLLRPELLPPLRQQAGVRLSAHRLLPQVLEPLAAQRLDLGDREPRVLGPLGAQSLPRAPPRRRPRLSQRVGVGILLLPERDSHARRAGGSRPGRAYERYAAAEALGGPARQRGPPGGRALEDGVDVLERRIRIRIVAGDFLTDLLLLLLGGGSRGVDLEPAKLALRRLVRVLFLAVFTRFHGVRVHLDANLIFFTHQPAHRRPVTDALHGRVERRVLHPASAVGYPAIGPVRKRVPRERLVHRSSIVPFVRVEGFDVPAARPEGRGGDERVPAVGVRPATLRGVPRLVVLGVKQRRFVAHDGGVVVVVELELVIARIL